MLTAGGHAPLRGSAKYWPDRSTERRPAARYRRGSAIFGSVWHCYQLHSYDLSHPRGAREMTLPTSTVSAYLAGKGEIGSNHQHWRRWPLLVLLANKRQIRGDDHLGGASHQALIAEGREVRLSRHHLGQLVAELAGPWQARRDSDQRRRGCQRRRDGPGQARPDRAADRRHRRPDRPVLRRTGRDGRRLPGLHRDHPGQVSVPPGRPARDAPPDVADAWEQARHAQGNDAPNLTIFNGGGYWVWSLGVVSFARSGFCPRISGSGVDSAPEPHLVMVTDPGRLPGAAGAVGCVRRAAARVRVVVGRRLARAGRSAGSLAGFP